MFPEFGLNLFSDRVKVAVRPDIPAAIDECWRGQCGFPDFVHMQQVELGSSTQNEGFAIIVCEKNLAIYGDG